MRRSFAGMTLVELVATVGILGLVTVFALPSFRGLQARQDMRVAQGTIQSAIYRLDQLSLAPSSIARDTGDGRDFDILGYGLVFARIPKKDYTGQVNVANCRVTVSNDFIAVVKFVRSKSGNSEIKPYLAAVDPATPQAGVCTLVARKYPKDMYVMPSQVRFSTGSSTPVIDDKNPWMITQPLASVGTSVGAFAASGYTNPFSIPAPVLVVRHATVKQNNVPLCYGVELSRYSQAIEIANKPAQGCTNE